MAALRFRPKPTLALARGRPCGEFEPADLLSRQRRLAIGVVLRARQQVPEERRELARGGDDGDLVPAPRPHALVEGAQWPRRANGDPSGLDEEDQGAGERPRVAELGGDEPSRPRLAMADRDLALRLREIELAELAGR